MTLMSLACEVPSKLASLALRVKGKRGGVGEAGWVEVTQFPSSAEAPYSLLGSHLLRVGAQWSLTHFLHLFNCKPFSLAYIFNKAFEALL